MKFLKEVILNTPFKVLELEFNAFARGHMEITELEFAEMLLRYTDVWDMESQLKVSFQKYVFKS